VKVCDKCHKSENDIRVAGGNDNDLRMGPVVWYPHPRRDYEDHQLSPWQVCSDLCSECSLDVLDFITGTTRPNKGYG
jgi:hypothetical protein